MQHRKVEDQPCSLQHKELDAQLEQLKTTLDEKPSGNGSGCLDLLISIKQMEQEIKMQQQQVIV